jgi:hypothetical protein
MIVDPIIWYTEREINHGTSPFPSNVLSPMTQMTVYFGYVTKLAADMY